MRTKENMMREKKAHLNTKLFISIVDKVARKNRIRRNLFLIVIRARKKKYKVGEN